MKEKIFFTGGNGYIGKNFIKNYSSKYLIDAPSRSKLDLREGAKVNQYVTNSNIDFVVQAANVGGAASSTRREEDCLLENLHAFRNVFQSCKDIKRFVHMGSGAEYSKPFANANVNEENFGEIIPEDAYGMAKFFMGQSLEQQKVGRYVNLRIFGNFGPYEDCMTRFISNAIVRSLYGLPIIVNQNSLFDYVYVNDFLKIMDCFIQNPAPHISYNITTGHPLTLIEIAEIICDVMGSKHEIIVKNKNIKEHYTGSNIRLRQFLPENFEFTPINMAIEELIEWYDKNIEQVDKQQLQGLNK